MRILTYCLCLTLASCSALPSPQRYGAPAGNSRITVYAPVKETYSAEDVDDSGGFMTDGDPEMGGWSAQIDYSYNGPGWLIGYSQREFGDVVDSTEYFAGGRYFLGGAEGNGYIVGQARYSNGLELPVGDSDEYWGWAVGVGVTRQVTDNIFLDFLTLYDGLFSDIGVSGSNEKIDLHGLVFSVGVAIGQ